MLLKAVEMDPLCVGARGETQRKTPTVGAFVHGAKCLGLGDDGGWTPQAVGSVSTVEEMTGERRHFVCMYAGYVHNISTNRDPTSLPMHGSHTFFGGLWLFLLTSNLCVRAGHR